MHKFVPHLPRIFLLIVLAGAYGATLAPGLSWANGGADGGDLISAAATGGVAHPSGYPTYLLLAGLVQQLPLGSLAFRTNLLSAGATLWAALLVYDLVSRHVKGQPWMTRSAALLAGLFFGLAPLVWSQALITEVYALHAWFTLLILRWSVDEGAPPGEQDDRRTDRLAALRGLALGLALGNHLTSLLWVPAALLIPAILPRPGARTPGKAGTRFSGRILLRSGLFGLIGLMVYLVLPLRALASPAINWGNPSSLARLWQLVSGHMYQEYFLQGQPALLWERTRALAALLVAQVGLFGLVLGLLGAVVFFSPSRLHFLTLWMFLSSALFTVLYAAPDGQVYFIPAVIAFALWIGIGVAGLGQVRLPKGGAVWRWGVVGLGCLWVGLAGLAQAPRVDASRDLRAESFGRRVMTEAPEAAIVFATGDRAVFSLWYFHFALKERPDLVVIASDLLFYDWYQESLISTYPALVVPQVFFSPDSLTAANPSRPVCSVQYTQEAEITCAGPQPSP